jgi:GTPase SAR1 family protein
MAGKTGIGLLTESLRASASDLGFAEQVSKIDDRVRDQSLPLMVMVVGEGNFGKSSLINALLGRQVAPVSRLPTTRILDLYETGVGDGKAELSWRSKPPETVPWEEAKDRWKEVETRARQGCDANDLYQIRWFVDGGWPRQPLVLVDTPGIDQVRQALARNTGASSDDIGYVATLYGSERIVAVKERPFQYFYHRADVVLWCVRATKLDSAGSLDALSAVAGQDKPVVLLLTCIDEVPPNLRDEVAARAKRTYPDYILDFLPVCSRGDSKLATETIGALRELLSEQFLKSQKAKKLAASIAFLGEELATLASNLDGLGAGYRDAFRLRQDLLRRQSEDLQLAVGRALSQLRPIFRDSQRTAIGNVEILSRTSPDANHLRSHIGDVIDRSELTRQIKTAQAELEATAERIGAEASAATWPAVEVAGEERTATVPAPRPHRPRRLSTPSIPHDVRLETDGFEQFITDVKWWWDQSTARQGLAEKAKPLIDKALDGVRAQTEHQFRDIPDKWQSELASQVDTAFTVAYGDPPAALAPKVAKMQTTLLSLIQQVDRITTGRAASLGAITTARAVMNTASASLSDCMASILDSDLRDAMLAGPATSRTAWFEALVAGAELGWVDAQREISRLIIEGRTSDIALSRPVLLLKLGEPQLIHQTFRTLARGNGCSRPLSKAECLELLRSDPPEPLARQVEESLLQFANQDDEVANYLLHSPRPNIAAAAANRLADTYRRSADGVIQRFQGLHVACPVTDIYIWASERDRALQVGQQWLDAARARPNLPLTNETAKVLSGMSFVQGPLTQNAAASEAAYRAALEQWQRARTMWQAIYVCSFVAWGIAFVLLAVNAGVAEIVWSASFVAFLVSRSSRRAANQPDAWRNHYSGPLRL